MKMTIENTASMDLTTLFKSCMKTIRTRNKAMGVTLPQAKIFPTSSQSSQFYTRAKDILINITSHKNLLRDHQKKYLQDHEQSMTDHERNYMEKVITTNLRIIDDNIKNINIDLESDEGSKDACEVRQNIIAILKLNFQQINSNFKEMKSKRKHKEKEKDHLFRLQRPTGMKKQQNNNIENSFHKSTKNSQNDKTSPSQEAYDSSQSENKSMTSSTNSEEIQSTTTKDEETNKSIESKHSSKDMTSSFMDEEMESMLSDLSNEERQMLEEENLHLYKELMSNQEEVKQITRQVVELGQMQDFFTEKVDVQAHQIDQIQETIMGATENVKEGNEQVREAMRKDAGFRVWIMFFLIVMSCTILFLDWYNG